MLAAGKVAAPVVEVLAQLALEAEGVEGVEEDVEGHRVPLGEGGEDEADGVADLQPRRLGAAEELATRVASPLESAAPQQCHRDTC